MRRVQKCLKCGKVKSIKQFKVDKRRAVGFSKFCLVCMEEEKKAAEKAMKAATKKKLKADKDGFVEVPAEWLKLDRPESKEIGFCPHCKGKMEITYHRATATIRMVD